MPRCPFGTMDWYCIHEEGHDGAHESESFDSPTPRYEGGPFRIASKRDPATRELTSRVESTAPESSSVPSATPRSEFMAFAESAFPNSRSLTPEESREFDASVEKHYTPVPISPPSPAETPPSATPQTAETPVWGEAVVYTENDRILALRQGYVAALIHDGKSDLGSIQGYRAEAAERFPFGPPRAAQPATTEPKIHGVTWILICDGMVLLERCPKKARVLGVGEWFIPVGKIEGDETAEAALQREMREEWGCAPLTMIPLPILEGSAIPPGPRGLFLMRPFVVTVIGAATLPLVSGDGVELRWTPVAEALASPVPQVRMMVAAALESPSDLKETPPHV